jgi:hypothetical protein
MAERFVIHDFARMWKAQGLPSRPAVSVGLGSHSVMTDGAIVITSALNTDRDVDSAIDSLIGELEELRTQAKELLKPAG